MEKALALRQTPQLALALDALSLRLECWVDKLLCSRCRDALEFDDDDDDDDVVDDDDGNEYFSLASNEISSSKASRHILSYKH